MAAKVSLMMYPQGLRPGARAFTWPSPPLVRHCRHWQKLPYIQKKTCYKNDSIFI